MKTGFFNSCALVGLLCVVACGDDENGKNNSNNIINESGTVPINLTWLTDGTEEQALLDADLDLIVRDGNNVIFDASESSSNFESLFLDSQNHPNDIYKVIVRLFENGANKDVDFKLTVSGGGKEIEIEGSFESDDGDLSSSTVLKITKEGDKYTIEEL